MSGSKDLLRFTAVAVFTVSMAMPHLCRADTAMEQAQSAILRHDYAGAASLYQRQSAAGNNEATYQLGLLYDKGLGVERDYARALYLFKSAADAGNAKAAFSCGESFEYGRGTNSDTGAALNWYEKAAQMGNTQAQAKIEYYHSGKNNVRDVSASKEERLIDACTRSNLANAEAALDQGADANSVDPYGNPALVIAINRKLDAIANLLLAHHANPNISNRSGDTPMVLAIQKDKEDMVRSLLQHNAAVDALDSYGNTPLMSAIKHNSQGVVKILLDAGADPMKKNKAGQSAIGIARDAGHKDIVDLLEKSGRVKALAPEKRETDQNAINAIVSNIENTRNKSGYEGWPDLTMAVWRGQRDVAEALIARGVDVNALTKNGETALGKASEKGDLPLIDMLLHHGARVDASANDAASPIVGAASGGHVEALKKLLPLYHRSADSGRILTLALNKSIDAHQEASAALLAEEGDRIAMGDNILAQSFLLRGAEIGSVSLVRISLQHGATLNGTNQEGVTALMLAAASGQKEVVDFLLKKGADLDLHDKHSQSALIYAIRAGKVDTANQLITAGAFTFSPDEKGFTPLMVAATQDQPELIQLLIEKGATIEVHNHENDTALTLAIRHKAMKAMTMLLDKGANPYRPFKTMSPIPDDVSAVLKHYWTMAGWIRETFDFLPKD